MRTAVDDEAGNRSSLFQSYTVVTLAYWGFTITDGALRMLVLLYFHDLGFSALSLAFLFVVYEAVGVATNLVGGWVGSRFGLNRTLFIGLALQVVALLTLSAVAPDWARWLSIVWVMGAQALSGAAKDLTKMSAKSAVKLVAADSEGQLFRWVAALTGSKNALKGVGFFAGAALLTQFGFRIALVLLAATISATLLVCVVFLRTELGRARNPPALGALLAKSPDINRLSAARMFLFGARDLWFVVAVPVFLSDTLDWSFNQVGAFMATWVIGYGLIQAIAPRLASGAGGSTWAALLVAITVALAVVATVDVVRSGVVIGGLAVFGFVFAINSSLHSYLIVSLADDDAVAADVGFYYAANAAGRLVGTLGSGLLFMLGGLAGSLWGSAAFVALSWMIITRLTLPAGSATS